MGPSCSGKGYVAASCHIQPRFQIVQYQYLTAVQPEAFHDLNYRIRARLPLLFIRIPTKDHIRLQLAVQHVIPGYIFTFRVRYNSHYAAWFLVFFYKFGKTGVKVRYYCICIVLPWFVLIVLFFFTKLQYVSAQLNMKQILQGARASYQASIPSGLQQMKDSVCPVCS